MSGAADIFDLLARSDDPEREIAALPHEQLKRLHDYLAHLPDTGFPGVIKASVTDECAVRYLKHGGAA